MGRRRHAMRLRVYIRDAKISPISSHGLANFERRLKHDLHSYGANGKVWEIRLFAALSVTLGIVFAITQNIRCRGRDGYFEL